MTMTAQAIPQLAERLLPLLQRARAASFQLGQPVLASLTVELAAAPNAPLSLAGRAPYFLWEQPSRGFALTGLGQAARIAGHGPQRFDAARADLQRLLGSAVIDRPGALPSAPIALAGSAFDPSQAADAALRPFDKAQGRQAQDAALRQAQDAAWRAFPDALVLFPRFLFGRRGADAWLTVNVVVDRRLPAESVAATLADEAARAHSAEPPLAPPEDARASIVSPDDRAPWRESVGALTGQIAAREAEKVVLARRVDVTARRPFDVDAVLGRLRRRYADCTLFAVADGEVCFLGATPETLVSLSQGRVHTDCLAGSAPRGASPDADDALAATLLADAKERREHDLVVGDLRRALAGLCGDIRLPPAPGVRRTASVQHLHTPIEATTGAATHVLDLVAALHPTPATAGLPRERALCLIRRHEGFSRGWYAGPIGWIDARGDGDFAVALRSALVHGDAASLYAGCGIVAGSDPDREYDESSLKLEAMLWALGAKA